MGARENYGNDGSTPNERCPECDERFYEVCPCGYDPLHEEEDDD